MLGCRRAGACGVLGPLLEGPPAPSGREGAHFGHTRGLCSMVAGLLHTFHVARSSGIHLSGKWLNFTNKGSDLAGNGRTKVLYHMQRVRVFPLSPLFQGRELPALLPGREARRSLEEAGWPPPQRARKCLRKLWSLWEKRGCEGDAAPQGPELSLEPGPAPPRSPPQTPLRASHPGTWHLAGMPGDHVGNAVGSASGSHEAVNTCVESKSVGWAARVWLGQRRGRKAVKPKVPMLTCSASDATSVTFITAAPLPWPWGTFLLRLDKQLCQGRLPGDTR